ncbi:hypothetical protein CYMTET_30000 [Cymbomonas tetramitiformis]|uniref:Uncharacterized protein n=1 Tax=Cymbomonas tetramitiformis TaxID=36881 RepID=A0AAE0FJP2_9CHLO|nr:hypothetical protein CYMTET_30000 [Cymbomonas tetramitiformis]
MDSIPTIMFTLSDVFSEMVSVDWPSAAGSILSPRATTADAGFTSKGALRQASEESVSGQCAEVGGLSEGHSLINMVSDGSDSGLAVVDAEAANAGTAANKEDGDMQLELIALASINSGISRQAGLRNAAETATRPATPPSSNALSEADFEQCNSNAENLRPASELAASELDSYKGWAQAGLRAELE